jgi:hypothetical protein
MNPEDKAKKFEEEGEEVEGEKKKPYITPELTKFAIIEDITGTVISAPGMQE